MALTHDPHRPAAPATVGRTGLTRRHTLAALGMAFSGAALLGSPGRSAAQASAAPPPTEPAEKASIATLLAALQAAPWVLMGEVHDNAVQHALRHEALAAHLAAGARPALLMEAFDREHQDAIDAWRRAHAPPGRALDPDQAEVQVDSLIAAGQGGRGWHWPHYRPVLVLALQHGLPLIAVNVSRADARRVIGEGLATLGFDAVLPAALATTQAQAVIDGHCGAVAAAMAGRMALAQVARDQAMARALRAWPQAAVLWAGNGHVRSDVGVPAWLDAAERARTLAVGLLEARADGTPPTDPPPFDRTLWTVAQPRPDPCAAFQMPSRTPSKLPSNPPAQSSAVVPR